MTTQRGAPSAGTECVAVDAISPVARMKRSANAGPLVPRGSNPDFASLHPGYGYAACSRRSIFTMSNSAVSSFPRRVSAPGFCFSLSIRPQPRGGRSAEKAQYFICRAVGRDGHACEARRAPAAAGRSPLGAPPWRFSAGGRASISGISSGSVQRCSSQPGRSAWRAGSRTSRGRRLRAAAAGRHSPLRLQDRL